MSVPDLLFRASIIGLVFLLLSFTSTVLAESGDDWESGQQAFAEHDYESALAYFERARNGGLEGPAVHYNIAVSQFKLGRYTDAGQTFFVIANRFPKMRGLAEYNIGLVARRLGDSAKAQEHFLRAYELSPDDRTIRVLASRRLRELEPDVRTASRWTGAIGIRAGIDDNVALRDDTGLPAGTDTESPLVDVFAVAQGPWDGRNGFRFDASAYVVRYLDADEFDQAKVSGGVFYDWRPNDWRVQFRIHASIGTLGGDAFDRIAGVRLRAVRYLNKSASIDLRYTYDDISDANALFAAIDGSRQQIDARYLWYRDGHRVQLRYWLENNDRIGPSVSPDRNRVTFDYRFQPEHGLGYEAGVDFRNSDYRDLAAPREEDLLTFRAALSYMLRDEWQVLIEYRNANNDSTDADFSYDRGQLTVGVLKVF